MRNIKLKIQYDGTDYHGWQIQKNDITVQETVKKAIQKIVNEKMKQESVCVTRVVRSDSCFLFILLFFLYQATLFINSVLFHFLELSSNHLETSVSKNCLYLRKCFPLQFSDSQ